MPENKVYGYARVSTPTQKLERQIRNIEAADKDAIIYKDKFTGTTLNRPEWNKLYKRLKEGDTVIFDSVSRMSRDAAEGIRIYEECFERGISLVFLKEPHINTDVYREAIKRQIEISIDTGDKPTDDFIQTIITALNKYAVDLAKKQIWLAFGQSEKEVTDLRQRTREGIETARRAGKQIGQQKGRTLNVKKANEAKEFIRKRCNYFGGNLTSEECMKLAGISKNSFYKYRKELIEEITRKE